MGEVYTAFLYIKLSQRIFHSAEHELAAWLLKLLGVGFSCTEIFLNCSVKVPHTWERKLPGKLGRDLFLKVCELKYYELNFNRHCVLERKSEAVPKGATQAERFVSALR